MDDRRLMYFKDPLVRWRCLGCWELFAMMDKSKSKNKNKKIRIRK